MATFMAAVFIPKLVEKFKGEGSSKEDGGDDESGGDGSKKSKPDDTTQKYERLEGINLYKIYINQIQIAIRFIYCYFSVVYYFLKNLGPESYLLDSLKF